MAVNKPVRRMAIVGTGVIGASWVALYLARGFAVIATDLTPNAEADLRRYVDTVWPALAVLGLSPKASPEHLDFTLGMQQASAHWWARSGKEGNHELAHTPLDEVWSSHRGP